LPKSVGGDASRICRLIREQGSVPVLFAKPANLAEREAILIRHQMQSMTEPRPLDRNERTVQIFAGGTQARDEIHAAVEK
jgi:hypothetical protein